MLLIIESLHNLPLDKISTLLKRHIQCQLQIVHKLVIPNCKDMLNVLYHKPWSKPKVVLRQNKGDTHLVSLFLKITYNKRTVFFCWQDICWFALKNVLQKNSWHNFGPTSWALSLFKVWKTAVRVNPGLWECLILGQKTTYSPWRRFFSSKNHYNIIFMYLLASFIMQNLQKYPWSRLRVMTAHHFCAQNGAIAPNIFFGKTTNTIFLYLFVPFIVQNF